MAEQQESKAGGWQARVAEVARNLGLSEAALTRETNREIIARVAKMLVDEEFARLHEAQKGEQDLPIADASGGVPANEIAGNWLDDAEKLRIFREEW